MAKKRQRSEKGTVSIKARGKMLRLRWTYEGEEYDRSPGLRDIPLNRIKAREIATQIERDISLGQFDRTCAKYFSKPSEPASVESLSTCDQWRRWMDKQEGEGVTLQTLSSRYQALLNLLHQFDRDILTADDAREFIALLHTRQSPNTSNRYLKMLKTFCDWSVEQSWLPDNPFSSIKPAKDAGHKTRDRPPFTVTEMKAILRAFKSHPRYCLYHDFALTLFLLGLRPSEAIGLQWKHLDFTARTVTVTESLSRSGEGVKRIQKGRKNGVTTVIDLPDRLYEVLQARVNSSSKPDTLVFTSPMGKPIDDHTFSQRVWRSVLTLANVPYRPPYNCRHSMASHAIHQGKPLTEVAYLMGHRDTSMVNRVYGHIIDRPNLPNLDI